MFNLEEFFDIKMILKLAITVVGVTQWIKSLFKSIKVPTWVWAIVMSVLAVGVVFAEQFYPVVNLILLVICVSQLGYEGIWQNIKKLFERFTGGKTEQSSMNRY